MGCESSKEFTSVIPLTFHLVNMQLKLWK